LWVTGIAGRVARCSQSSRSIATMRRSKCNTSTEEFDLEAWEEQEFEEAQAPEDWTGSVDVDAEDTEAEREVSTGTSWTDPLMSLDRSEASGYSEWPAPLDL
jgi:hypothetical protein